MGDLGLRRRPPDGWLPATVASTGHRLWSHPGDPDSGAATIETSLRLAVTWRVQVPGREPYLLQDERDCPMWALANAFGGQGKRWYTIRLKRTHGLLVDVDIPCAVDPADPTKLWIDWDEAYAAHEPVWRDKGKRDRAAAERTAAQERVAAQAAAQTAAWTGVDPAAKAEYDRFAAELARIADVGRRAEGTVRSVTDTGRLMVGIPVRRFEIDIADPTPRTVAVELPMQPQLLEGYRPGAAVVVKVDPEAPHLVAITRD